MTKAWSRFKHALTGRQTIEREHPIGRFGVDPQPIGGEHGSYSRSDTLTHTEIDLTEESYTSDAYVKLIVNSGGFEDVYWVPNTEEFTSADEAYNAPDDE